MLTVKNTEEQIRFKKGDRRMKEKVTSVLPILPSTYDCRRRSLAEREYLLTYSMEQSPS
jgi:hypothetical protein